MTELPGNGNGAGATWQAAPGRTLGAGRYLLLDRIGQGDVGDVWAALIQGTDQSVALKVIHPEIARDDDHLAGFAQEARAMARIDHEGVIRLIDQERPTRPGAPYFLVMELAEGHPLDLAGEPLDRVLNTFDHLLEVLAHIHSRGLVHRDLRHGNVFMREGRGFPIKVLDIGLSFTGETLAARLKASPLSRQGELVGEMAWTMSPEQARGDHASVGPVTDLYAVGAMLHHVLSGRPMFDGTYWGTALSHLHETPAPIHLEGLDEDSTQAINALLSELLAKDVNDRPETAADVRHRLQLILDGLPEPCPCVPEPPRPAQVSDTRPPSLMNWADDNQATAQAIPAIRLGDDNPMGQSGSAYDHAPWTLRFMGEQPLLGRRDQAVRLEELLDEVAEGNPARGAIVVGQAGGGKRRLARWLVERAVERGLARVLEIPLDARELLSGSLRLGLYRHLRQPLLMRHAVRLRVDNVLAFERDEDAELLTEFLVAPPELTGSRERLDARADFWKRTLQRLVTRPTPRPLLIWLDGGHHDNWEDVATFCRELLGSARDQNLPVCLLWSPRGDETPPQEIEGMEVLTVGPISDEAAGALARRLEPEIAPETLKVLVERGQGNPGLMQELLRTWRETDAYRRTPQGLTISALMTHFPVDLADAQRRRLAAFLSGQPDPGVLERAFKLMALLGPVFSRHQAAWCMEGTGLIPEDLIQLGWLIHRPLAQEPQLLFASPTLHDLIVANARDRGEIPGLVEACVEVLTRGAFDSIVDRDWASAHYGLTNALKLAEDHAPAERRAELRLRALDLMGHLSLRRHDSDAARAVARATRAMTTTAPGPLRPRLHARAILWEGQATRLEGNREEAEALLRSVVDQHQASDPPSAALAWFALGDLALERQDTEAAERLLQQARTALKTLAEETHTPGLRRLLNLTRADATRHLAAIYEMKGNVGLVTRLLNRAMSVYQENIDPYGETLSYVQLTSALRKRLEQQETPNAEELERATRYWNRLSALMSSLGQRDGLTRVVWEGACLADLSGDHERAMAHYRTAARCFELEGDLVGQIRSLQRLARVTRRVGQATAAISHLGRAHKVAERLGNGPLQASSLIEMAWIHLGQEQHREAEGRLRAAINALPEGTHADMRATAWVILAESAVKRDDLTQAADHLKAADAALGGGKPVADLEARRALGRISDTLRESPSLLARAVRSLTAGLNA